MKHIIILTLTFVALTQLVCVPASAVLSSADSVAIESAIAEIEAQASVERVAALERRKEQRQKIIRKVWINVSKAVGIVLCLLALRWIIGFIGQTVGTEKSYPNVIETNSVAILFVGAPSQEAAAGIGRCLVEERLAACTNIIDGTCLRSPAGEPVPEALMVIKTARRKLKLLVTRVRELHMNPTPEIIPYPIDQGLKSYVHWILESTDSKPWWVRK